MKCFHCGEEIKSKYRIIPLDKPYVNLYFHREECFKETDVEKYIHENIDKILKYIEEN